MSYQVLARKWRPANFHQLVGQEHVKKALITALDAERLHHAYLFTGTRGVGKTTIARILSKCLNCDKGISSTPCGSCSSCTAIAEGRFVDLIEVDAASRTKVDDTRELLDNVQYRPTEGRYKVYLIDEVHMLSTHSFNALLKTLEEPPPHVIFLLATTDPQKLPVTVLSRCLQFHLRHMSETEISQHLGFILGEEKISFDTESLDLIAAASDGSMRDGLSLLDQAIAHGGGVIKQDDVKEMLGTVERAPIWALFEHILDRDDAAVFSAIDSVSAFSNDFSPVLEEMLHVLHQLAVAQKLPSELQKLSPQTQALAERMSAEDIQLYYQIILHGRRDLPLASSSRMGFEMTVLRLMAFQPAVELPLSATQQPAQKKTLDNSTESKAAPIVSETNPASNSIVDQQSGQYTSKPNPAATQTQLQSPSSAMLQTANQPELVNEAESEAENEAPVEKSIVKPLESKVEVPLEQPATVQPNEIAQKTDVTAENWPQITAALKLDGMCRQMMINSRFISQIDDQLRVSCQNFLPQALTSERQNQINLATSAAVGIQCQVNIEAEEDYQKNEKSSSEAGGEARGESAMEVTRREITEKQQQAEFTINNDSLVKDVIAKFDGKIKPDSVKPLL
jgi:DNA polymerase-3 subunit gamma/tau